MNDEAQRVISLFERASSNRGNWESHWEEIAERILPSYKGYFNSRWVTKGEKRTQELFDSTGQIALGRFASILDSLLTPRNQKWHRLSATDPELNKNREVKSYFDEVTKVLFKYRYAPMANFSAQNQSNYVSLGAFGSGSLFIDDLQSTPGTFQPGIRYKHTNLGETYFLENHQGIVDTVIRCFRMTVRQAYQKWGDELSEKMMGDLKSNPEREYYFLHAVEPNKDFDPERADYRGMPYSSIYVSFSCKKELERGGYSTMPYAVSRYQQSPNEVYGRGPAMAVLPALKTLNEQKKTLLKQGHRAVNPVLLAHDDGVLDNINMKPGAINFGGVDANGRPLVQTLPVGNPMIGVELMDMERQVINDTFLVTIFQILTETPAMTATEVMERTREKGILLAPTIGRQQSEYLGPMIERELDVLSRQNLLPEMPPILVEAGADFEVEYDSPLSRAQRAEEASGLMRTVETALGIVNVTQNPALLDHFNWDVIMPELADINAVPTRWTRAVEEVQAIRQSRAESAEQQQAAQMAPSMAAMMKQQEQG